MDKQDLLMKTALLWSSASHAKRSQVGCVIAKDKRILATGYNGTLPGRDNCCEVEGSTKDEVMHAEQNALMFCAKNGVSVEGCDLYVTMSPCMMCSKMIIMSGIKKVYYNSVYRDTSPLELLQESGVETIHHEVE